jgi:hypothetical protein
MEDEDDWTTINSVSDDDDPHKAAETQAPTKMNNLCSHRVEFINASSSDDPDVDEWLRLAENTLTAVSPRAREGLASLMPGGARSVDDRENQPAAPAHTGESSCDLIGAVGVGGGEAENLIISAGKTERGDRGKEEKQEENVTFWDPARLTLAVCDGVCTTPEVSPES